MPGQHYSVPYADGLTLLAIAFGLLWIRLTGRCPARACGRLALTVGGYLRRRPSQVAEEQLRAAFGDLDRELTAILGDRPQIR